MAALGAALAASPGCGNISLSSAVEPGPLSGAATPARPDASPDASVSSAPADGAVSVSPTVDAGAAPTSVGNPLCFVDYSPDADAGAHICQPDTSSLCPGQVDAGVYTPPPPEAGDGGVSDVGPACHVVANGQKCTALGTGRDGDQCQTGADCTASFECVGSPGRCRHYCCDGNATCDSARGQMMSAAFCDVQAMTAGGLNVPVCEPVTKCTPLLMGNGPGTCPQGETCAVVKDDGTTSCVTIGTVGVGRDCREFHCAAELTCLGPVGNRTCFQLCQVDSPTACPSGTTCTTSAQLFTNSNIGICQ